MSNLIQLDDAESNVFSCAVLVADRIGSADGHAEAAANLASRLAAKGELDLAAQMADAIQDPHARDAALAEIAARCAEFDDDEYGVQLADAIEEYGFQQQALANLAVRQAERGKLDEALETANSLDDAQPTLGEIAVRFARRGDDERAENVLAEVDLPIVRAQVLNEFAAIRHAHGESPEKRLTESLAEIEHIEFAEEKIQMLLEIAVRFLDAKQPERALEVLEKIKQLAAALDARFRDQILTQTSALYAHAGNFEAAENVLKPIADLQQTASAHTTIALEHEARDAHESAVQSLEEAYAVLQSQPEREIRDSRARYNLLSAIAIRFAQFGRTERALEIAVKNPFENARWQALGQIAAICAASGEAEMARQAVAAIEDLAARATALILVSDGEMKSAGAEKSLQTLAEANSLTEEVVQLPLRVAALNDIAIRLVERGEREQAAEVLRESLQTTGEILDQTEQAVSLANTAEIYEKFDFEIGEPEREILRAIVRRRI